METAIGLRHAGSRDSDVKRSKSTDIRLQRKLSNLNRSKKFRNQNSYLFDRKGKS